MDDLIAILNRHAAEIVAYRLRWQNHRIEERRNEMSRLTDKLKLAGGVAARQTVKIEARADSLIARESEIEKQTDNAFSPHEAILSEAERGLQAIERQLALLSNDPLEPSGEPQEGAREHSNGSEPPPDPLKHEPPALPQAGRSGIGGMYR